MCSSYVYSYVSTLTISYVAVMVAFLCTEKFKFGDVES